MTYMEAIKGSRMKYNRGNRTEDAQLCDDAFEELLEDARGLAAKLSAAEERDRWVLVSERLPEQGASVAFVLRAHIDPAYVMHCRFGPFKFGGFDAGETLCWRPARPVGELPGGER